MMLSCLSINYRTNTCFIVIYLILFTNQLETHHKNLISFPAWNRIFSSLFEMRDSHDLFFSICSIHVIAKYRIVVVYLESLRFIFILQFGISNTPKLQNDHVLKTTPMQEEVYNSLLNRDTSFLETGSSCVRQMKRNLT